MLFFTLNREDFSFVIHLDRQPRTSRRREAQTGSRARSGSRSERTLDAVEHSRTVMEWWPFLIFHRGGLRIKVINNSMVHFSVTAHPTSEWTAQQPAVRAQNPFGSIKWKGQTTWSGDAGVILRSCKTSFELVPNLRPGCDMTLSPNHEH